VSSSGPVIGGDAIPHEAGHILVGRVVGIWARGLTVDFERFPNGGAAIGNFATLGFEPPDDEIAGMDDKLKAAFILFIAGGVAGNKFVGLTTIGPEADADRKSLARLTDMSLEAASDMALELIKPKRRAFRQLVSLIRQRFTDRVLKNRDIQTGSHMLVTEEDLDKLFSEYVEVDLDQKPTSEGDQESSGKSSGETLT
jgi:hypothetical protein